MAYVNISNYDISKVTVNFDWVQIYNIREKRVVLVERCIECYTIFLDGQAVVIPCQPTFTCKDCEIEQLWSRFFDYLNSIIELYDLELGDSKDYVMDILEANSSGFEIFFNLFPLHKIDQNCDLEYTGCMVRVPRDEIIEIQNEILSCKSCFKYHEEDGHDWNYELSHVRDEQGIIRRECDYCLRQESASINYGDFEFQGVSA